MKNRSAPTATVVPVLVYDDVAEAATWLCRAFGFGERLRYVRRDGRVTHAQLAVAEGAIMLGSPGGEFRPAAAGLTSQYVVVHVDDVDAHCARAKQAGARVRVAPATQPFGERQYTVEDIGGHRWTFSQHVADVAPAEWGAVAAGVAPE